MVALGKLFTRSLRDEERRDLDRAMTVKTLADGSERSVALDAFLNSL
jgi:hypothetical protein